MRRALRLLLGLSLASVGFAQGDGHVWVVDEHGAGDFTVIQDAVQAASPGDRILVRDGDYPGFKILGKTLVVEADAGARVRIQGEVEVGHLFSVEWVVLRGLHTSDALVAPDEVATLYVHGGAGKTWIEDCSFGVPADLAAASAFAGDAGYVQGSNAILVRSTFSGGAGRDGAPGGAGLFMTTGNLWAHGCTLRGGPGLALGSAPSPGGHGLLQDGGFLSIAGSQLVGGDGGNATDPLPCADGADGGHGALLVGNSPVHEAHDVAFVGGSGGSSVCGAPGADGRPRLVTVVGLITDYPGLAVSARAASPVVVGASLALELHGAPGDLVVLTSAGYPHVTDVPSTIGWLLIGQPGAVIDRVVVPASGVLALTYPVPPLGPHVLVSQELFLQPVAVRPAVDGLRIVHGAPTAVGILSTAF